MKAQIQLLLHIKLWIMQKKKTLIMLLIDTAGRLQNKKNLMDEFKKINNVLKKN